MKESETFVKNIFQVPEYANFISYVDGKLRTRDCYSYEIHKIVLAKKSIYFQTLFSESCCTKKKEFFIPGISGDCLNEILLYMYADNIRLNSENMIDILMASDYFMMTDLRTIIQENVKHNLSIDNSLELLVLSEHLNDNVIFQETFRFIQVKFEEIMGIKKDDLKYISFETLKRFLTTRSLNIQSERTAWLAIEAWIGTQESGRKRHVPFLLKFLALEDMNENVATEIMDHDLIINNSHVKKLCPSSNSSSRNHDHLKSIVLLNNTDLMKDVFRRRIPENLHIIAEKDEEVKDEDRDSYHLYITYDENLDLWHRLDEVPFYPRIVNIEHNLYIFRSFGGFKLDLRNREVVLLNRHRRSFLRVSVSVMKNKVYFLTKYYENNNEPYILHSGIGKYSINIFDCNTNSWAVDTERFDIEYGNCVSVGECIYVVGSIKDEGVMTAYVFDTTPPKWFGFRAQQLPESDWRRIPGPTVVRFSWFRLDSYHNKIFIFGGDDRDGNTLRSVEALNVESHTWTRLEDLPFQPFILDSVILNDRVFVFDTCYEVNSKIAVWNDDLEKWVKLEVKGTLENFKWVLKGFQFDANSFWQNRRDARTSNETSYHKFCTVKDTEAISYLFNMNKTLPFVRSHFSEKNTFEQDWFIEKEKKIII